jgi:hypothetical protein
MHVVSNTTYCYSSVIVYSIVCIILAQQGIEASTVSCAA